MVRSTASRSLRRLGDESGISVTELLVAMAVSLIVLAATFTALEAFARTVPKERERAHSIFEVQVGLARMVRELRQSYKVLSRTPDEMHVMVRSDAQTKEVVYSCGEPHPTQTGLYRCLRWEVNGGAPGAKNVVIDRTLNGPNESVADRTFSQPDAGSPNWVTVKVQVSAKGERSKGYAHKVTLLDGFYMRNCDATC